MKKITFILCLTAFISLIFQFNALAECPDGKIPVQITTPSGKTKTLCVSENAADGIENATENSATTIVPAICPKECWSGEFIEILANKGTLECAYDVGAYICILYNDTGGIEYNLGMKLYDDGTGYCQTEEGAGAYIEKDEIDACLAILETYDVSVTCPCWTEDELVKISKTKGYTCEEGKDSSGAFILCHNSTNKLVGVISDRTTCINFVSGVRVDGLSGEEGGICTDNLRLTHGVYPASSPTLTLE